MRMHRQGGKLRSHRYSHVGERGGRDLANEESEASWALLMGRIGKYVYGFRLMTNSARAGKSFKLSTQAGKSLYS
jgi:hypothetical protein